MRYFILALLALSILGGASAASFNITARDNVTLANINAFTVYITDYQGGVLNSSCFQETANVSSACGGLSTGNYSFDAYYFSINYSKPRGATGAIWMTKEGVTGVGLVNNSLPSTHACYTAYSDILRLRMFSNRSAGISRAECYNGTAFETLTNYGLAIGSGTTTANTANLYDGNYGTGSAYDHIGGTWNTSQTNSGAVIWEESIYWNISNASAFTVTTTYNTVNGTVAFSNNSLAPTANVTVSAVGYTPETFTNQPTNSNLTANLSQRNVNIFIYDENTGLLLTGTNITLVIDTTTTENTTTTTNGTYTFAKIATDSYIIKASAAGYQQRSYQANISGTVNISVYLANNTGNVTLTVVDKDISTILISGATVTFARMINNTWTTVSTISTDIVGTAVFSYVPLARYRVTASATGYISKVFYLDPIQFDSYTVQLQKTATVDNYQDFSKVDIIISPTSFINGNTTTILFTIASPTGTLTRYNVSANYPGGSNTTSGSQPQGQTLSIGVSISGATAIDFLNLTFTYTTTLGTKNFTRTFPIINQPSTPNVQQSGCTRYSMGDFECAGIATGITGLFAALGFLYAGPVGGGAIALIFVAFFAKIGFFNLYAIVGSMIVGFAILAWRSSE